MKEESRREHNPVHAASEEALRRAERLAPLEESLGKTTGQGAGNGSGMDLDTGALQLPKSLEEEDEKKEWRFMGFDSLALVILIFSLAFIAFITYLISIEPPK